VMEQSGRSPQCKIVPTNHRTRNNNVPAIPTATGLHRVRMPIPKGHKGKTQRGNVVQQQNRHHQINNRVAGTNRPPPAVTVLDQGSEQQQYVTTASNAFTRLGKRSEYNGTQYLRLANNGTTV